MQERELSQIQPKPATGKPSETQVSSGKARFNIQKLKMPFLVGIIPGVAGLLHITHVTE